MASWRDAFDEDTQNDLDRIFLSAPGFAASQIEQGAGFTPYAAHMDLSGTVALMASDGEPTGDGDASAHIATLSEVLAMNSDQIRATAIVSDVTTASGDAIAVHLEHRAGASIRVVIPYTRGDGGATVHDPAGVEEVPALVFG